MAAAAEEMRNCKSRTVKLLCAALSKIVPYEVWEEQRLDLGSIARALGLEPSTLKLNGHLIGRGANLMSSVTWKSLLNYFSGKGLPTGKTDQDALIVAGKLCKVGSKRGKQDGELDDGGIAGAAQTEDATNLVKHKKLKGSDRTGGQGITWNGHALKRKQVTMEDIDSMKKLKINESSPPSDTAPRKNKVVMAAAGITSSSRSKCRYLKRKSEDDVLLVASPCKRIH
ncbi:unnamed protein product [Linum trigynum]|uniref:Uncharacterized protein n=1 Tax=Linum trigynum TaxID=586398 RepID=A0AAV2D0M5_9ROSI